MTDTTVPDQKPKKIRKILLILGTVLVVGAGAGFSYPYVAEKFLTQEVEQITEVSPAKPKVAEHLVGRITVALRQDDEIAKKRYLVIDTVIEYDQVAPPAEAEDETAAPVFNNSVLRDSFIEYLSQVTEKDISGTSGLNALRSELLRRAQAVAEGPKPKAILIQDYIIQ